jgi:hypothetical protein
VLGFDTEMSMDHHWGPRCQLFLSAADQTARREELWKKLSAELPTVYRGFPTSFTEPDPNDKGTQLLDPNATGPVNHRVEILSLEGYFADYLGIPLDRELSASTWLALPSQKLRTVVDGRVFHDGLGLQSIRDRLAWYPKDVWLYILASGWTRIGQEEHLMGRAGLAGDELGSSLIGSRLVRDIMRLAFHLERKYPPYPKWFGRAFRELESSAVLAPLLLGAVHSTDWKQREENLAPALELMVKRQNALGITGELPAATSPFWGRPFRVVGGEKIAGALAEQIADPHLKQLAAERPIGSVDLLSDNTDLLCNAALKPILAKLYE